MLNVYAAAWCPHCRRTVRFLKERHIEFNYMEMEEQPAETIQKVIEVNGGIDWVVPTLEYQGQWRPGKVFDSKVLHADLQEMGVICTAE